MKFTSLLSTESNTVCLHFVGVHFCDFLVCNCSIIAVLLLDQGFGIHFPYNYIRSVQSFHSQFSDLHALNSLLSISRLGLSRLIFSTLVLVCHWSISCALDANVLEVTKLTLKIKLILIKGSFVNYRYRIQTQ